MNRPITENRLFDEIDLGQRAELSRKLTEDDITLFSRVSGNLNPLHSGHGPGPHTVHAQWSSSIISGLLGNALPGPGTALQHLDVDFLRPVSPGDTVNASIEVIEKRAPDRIVFACRVELSGGESVMQGRAEVIAPQVRRLLRELLRDKARPRRRRLMRRRRQLFRRVRLEHVLRGGDDCVVTLLGWLRRIQANIEGGIVVNCAIVEAGRGRRPLGWRSAR